MRRDAASTPQARRRANIEGRLLSALARLRKIKQYPSVTDLARESGVGRNAIYTSHRRVLAMLRGTPDGRRSKTPRPPSVERALRVEITALTEQVQKIGIENAGLVKRTLDAERKAERLTKQVAELLRKLNSTQVSVLHAVGADACGTSRK